MASVSTQQASHQSHDKELMILSETNDEISNTSKAVSYSLDNRCAICCNEVILILRLLPNLSASEATEENSCLYRVSGQKTANVKSLPPYSVADDMVDVLASVKTLSEEERQLFATDPTMFSDPFFSANGRDGFKHAVFSPICPGLERSYLGAVTLDGRIFIFIEHNEMWKLILEVTPVIKEHATQQLSLPLTVGKDMPFQDYKELIHSITTTEIAWSSVFENESAPKESSFLLFCGSLNGHTTIWLVKPPILGSEQVTFIDTDKHQRGSEVTALAWNSSKTSSNIGYLAIGYMDGSVRCLSIKRLMVKDYQVVTVEEVLEADYADDQAVADVGWLKVDEETDVLLAGRHTFLSIFSLEDGKMFEVENIKLGITWPIGGISTSKQYGCVSCEDDTLFYVTPVKEEGKVNILLTKKKIDCLPPAPGRVWLCHGAALSHSGALCVSFHRPIDNIVRSYRKSRVLDRQRVILSTPDIFSFDLSLQDLPDQDYISQDVMLRMALDLQNDFKMGEETEEVLRQLKACIESEETCYLQVARVALLYGRFLPSLARLEENKDEPGLLHEVTEKILRLHVLSILQEVSASFEGGVSTMNFLPLSSLFKWMQGSEERFRYFHDNLDINRLCSSFKMENLSCVVCGDQLEFSDLLEARCCKGHKIKLCCQSFTPCWGWTVRNCEACHAASLSPEDLAATKIFTKNKKCTLCGGFLVQKTT